MFQFIQFTRNTFIRIIGVFYQVFGFWGRLLRQTGRLLSQLLGFDREGYFLDSDDAQAVNQGESQPSTPIEPSQAQRRFAEPVGTSASSRSGSNTGSNTSATRRRPGSDMNYFRDMAREIKNS